MNPSEDRPARNYISRAGFDALESELRHLLRVERPKIVEVVSWAAGNGDRSENGDYIYGKKRLREIDRRVRFLTKRMESAEIVDPTAPRRTDRIFFGATVCYADEQDNERTVTLVGVDEADQGAGRISLASPLAKALLGRARGDEVAVQTPSGPVTIEILSIAYPGKS
jgi:transcription elongation factor GreB